MLTQIRNHIYRKPKQLLDFGSHVIYIVKDSIIIEQVPVGTTMRPGSGLRVAEEVVVVGGIDK